jgi:hypothetical protein
MATSGFIGNTPINLNGSSSPQTQLGGAPKRDGEAGKAGKAFLKALDTLSFDPDVFAYWIVCHGGKTLRKRILQVVFSIVRTLADCYDSGDMDDETCNAKRLTDTMAIYNMEQ